METMYDRIRKLRKEQGITQDELAKKTGYSDKTAIAKIEKGIVDIPQSKIVAFAKALYVPAGYLFDGSSANENQENSSVELTSQEQDHINKYRCLDDIDKARIDERMDVMLEDEKYHKKDITIAG